MAVKLFILEAAAYKAHKELDLAYNTTHKIYTKLRLGGKRKAVEEEKQRIKFLCLEFLKEMEKSKLR